MLIKDLTFLTDSRPFDIVNGKQKRIDLVLLKIPQSQCPQKIYPTFFFPDSSQEIFFMQSTKADPYKKFFDCLGLHKKKLLQREIIFYGKSRVPTKTEIAFDKEIYGTVSDPITNRPLLNVNILLYPDESSEPLASTTTNASGNYLLSCIPANTYRIIVRKLGYYPFRTKFTIPSNQQFSAINIPLFPKSNLNCKTKKQSEEESI